MVDDEPQKYTIAKLHAIKDDHEKWVGKTLGVSQNDGVETPEMITEVVHSTILPVDRLPRFVYGVACNLPDERQVSSQLRPLSDGEMAPFILREDMLFAFQNLNHEDGPFANIVAGKSVEQYHCRDWWDDPDQMKWFVDLTNRALNKLTGRKGLFLDRDHRRYYFQSPQLGNELKIIYRPLNQKSIQRSVVWQPINKRTGNKRDFWYHRAVSLRFFRTDIMKWGLSIRPELRVTVDGINPLPSKKIGSKVTKKKSRVFNYGLLGEVNFWRDYLSDSKPRIIFSFRDNQYIVVSTTMMQGSIVWPGIPAEFAKQFKNVEYADDLFSWAELQELGVDNESRVGDDEIDWDEDEELEDE